jgi:hypothetical protein
MNASMRCWLATGKPWDMDTKIANKKAVWHAGGSARATAVRRLRPVRHSSVSFCFSTTFL